jgi:diguanylate cyclase (GGDEF)-like protein
MSVSAPWETPAVADGRAAVPLAVAEALVALTEQALDGGLERALHDVLPGLSEAIGARSITVDLTDDGTGPPDVQVDVDDATLAAAVAKVLASAVGASQRAVASHATDTAQVDELRALARLDDLTGALNRRAFLEVLDEAVAKATRGGPPVTLALCDLDGLKAINDLHGHPTGDAALRALVDLLSTNLRTYDSVGRVGGDEFALLLQGAESEATAAIVCRLATTIEGGAAGVADVRASFGTARCPDDGTTRDALMELADARLYEDKNRTRSGDDRQT